MLRRRATNTGTYFARAKDHVTWFGSGCKPLDLALGGGWAAPYIINVVGDKSSGKTLLAIEAAINFCKVFPRGEVIYKRAERTFDPPYAEALGLPLDRVDLGTESVVVVEDIYAELDRLTAKGRKTPPPRLYVIDSWDAVKHKAELERGIGEADYGRKALLLSEFLRRLEAPMVDAKVTLFMISQTRAAIGSLFKKQQRSGGVALDFYASQIVWLHQAGFIQRETTIDGKKVTRKTGTRIIANVDKNKFGLQSRRAYFDLLYGYGTDDLKACLDFLDKSGGLPKLRAALNGTKPSELITKVRNRADGWEPLLNALHQVVEAHWWEIEARFLPARGKYR